ncbi:MAG: hypothetical protein V3R66_00570 [Rhodospirillales bacterium]
MRTPVLILALLIFSGCSDATVLGGGPGWVWVKEPIIGSGDPDIAAAKYCAQYGKKAFFEQRMQLNKDQVLQPTLKYACR